MCAVREKQSTMAAWRRQDLKTKGKNERFQGTDVGQAGFQCTGLGCFRREKSKHQALRKYGSHLYIVLSGEERVYRSLPHVQRDRGRQSMS